MCFLHLLPPQNGHQLPTEQQNLVVVLVTQCRTYISVLAVTVNNDHVLPDCHECV